MAYKFSPVKYIPNIKLHRDFREVLMQTFIW